MKNLTTDVIILAFNKDIASEIKLKLQGLETKSFFTPSEQQSQLINFVMDGEGNGIVQAVAGAGKTTTILQSINELRLKYQTAPAEIKRRSIEYGDFSVSSSTQHALAFKILKSVHKDLVIDKYKLSNIMKKIFHENGNWYKSGQHELLTDDRVMALCKDIYREQDEKLLQRYREKLQTWNSNRKGSKPKPPLEKKYPSKKAYDWLLSSTKKLLTALINGAINCGVGLIPQYPMTMDGMRKIYTDLSIEPRSLNGTFFEDRRTKVRTARFASYSFNSQGDRIPPNFDYQYDLLQKDKICEIALSVVQYFHDQKASSGVDYNLMIYKAVQNQSGKLAYPRYDFIFQDECQDTNKITMELLSRILKPNGRVIGVGDVAQAIYGFRGADSYAMQNFRDRFNCSEIPLTTCYRCAKSILEDVRQLGTIYSSIQPTSNASLGNSEKVPLEVGVLTKLELVRKIEDDGKIKEVRIINPHFLDKSFFNKDTAFISRNNNDLVKTARIFLLAGIPFKLVDSKPEDEDMFAKYTNSQKEEDDDDSSSSGVDFSNKEEGAKFIDKTMQKLESIMKILKFTGVKMKTNWGMKKKTFDNSRKYKKVKDSNGKWSVGDEIRNPLDTSVNWFMALYRKWMLTIIWLFETNGGELEDINNQIDFYNETVAIMTGVMNRYGNQAIVIAPTFKLQLVNVKKYLLSVYKELGSDNAVTLVTAHKSKGLEFPRVLLQGSSFNTPPVPRDADMVASEIQEMNMLYVAMTRAEKELIIIGGGEDDDKGDVQDPLRDLLEFFPFFDLDFRHSLTPSRSEAYAFIEEFEDKNNFINFVNSQRKRIGFFADINNKRTDDPNSSYKFILDPQVWELGERDIISIRLFDGQGGLFIEEIDEGAEYILDSREVDSIKEKLTNRMVRFLQR